MRKGVKENNADVWKSKIEPDLGKLADYK